VLYGKASINSPLQGIALHELWVLSSGLSLLLLYVRVGSTVQEHRN
jgi:hypothetical protein